MQSAVITRETLKRRGDMFLVGECSIASVMGTDALLSYGISSPGERERLIEQMICEHPQFPLDRLAAGNVHELWLHGEQLVGLFDIEARLQESEACLSVMCRVGLCYLLASERGKGYGVAAVRGVGKRLLDRVTVELVPEAKSGGKGVEFKIKADLYSKRGEMVSDVFCDTILLGGDGIFSEGVRFGMDSRGCR